MKETNGLDSRVVYPPRSLTAPAVAEAISLTLDEYSEHVDVCKTEFAGSILKKLGFRD